MSRKNNLALMLGHEGMHSPMISKTYVRLMYILVWFLPTQMDLQSWFWHLLIKGSNLQSELFQMENVDVLLHGRTSLLFVYRYLSEPLVNSFMYVFIVVKCLSGIVCTITSCTILQRPQFSTETSLKYSTVLQRAQWNTEHKILKSRTLSPI